MATTVAIHQPNYAPWCGFFAKAAHCDTFVFLDDVQMPRGRSWVNRTRIVIQGSARWLSVPCSRSSTSEIREVALADDDWRVKHLRTFQASYGRSRFYDETMSVLAPLYAGSETSLSEFNERVIRAIAEHLGLAPAWVRSSALASSGTGEDRIISLARSAGASTYLSGPGANAYQTAAAFERAGLDLLVKEYVPVPYDQGTQDFIGGLSILDALFHTGPSARELLHYADST